MPVQETGKLHDSTHYQETANSAPPTAHDAVLDLDHPYPRSVATKEVVTSDAVTPADMLSISRLPADDKRQSMDGGSTNLHVTEVWMTDFGLLIRLLR